jgi:YYY domain-containing protein
VLLRGPRGDAAWRAVAEALAAGLALGALYAINSWSYPVAAGLLVLAVVAWLRDPRSEGHRGFVVTWLGLVLLASVVLVLPFWLEFDPSADGIGWARDRQPFTRFAGQLGLIYGVLAWPLAAAFAARAMATRRPWRTAAWTAVAIAFAGSLLALADLTWAGLLFAAGAVAAGAVLSRGIPAPERFLWLLIAGGLGCVALPEVVVVRDAFFGGPFERMNTVFKLGYHAYLLLAVAAALALGWSGSWLGRRTWTVWAAVAAVLLLLGGVYPYAGTYASRAGFARTPTLDGLVWLRERAPGDVAAIEWLRENTPGDAVLLEAVGEDYSAFGHARMSTFTGRATVLGWAGHELQWSHDPGRREQDVRRLYVTPNALVARPLIARYGIDYVVVGALERTGYGNGGIDKWEVLGRRVFAAQGTEVYRLGT